MMIRALLVLTYIWHCLVRRTMPSDFFQLNADYFNDKKGLFSKLDINELIHPRWRLRQYSVESLPETFSYPVFIKPEWGQNSAGVARIDSEHALRQALSQQTSDQPPYLVQECALEAREFEIYLIQSAESPEQYATLSITEVLNNSGDTLPVNGIKNSATSYVDITESFSPEQLDILWSYLKTIGTFRTARYGIRANDIEALLAGDFKVFEINLFLPMPLVLLCQNVGLWRQVQLVNRLTAQLARVTGSIPKQQKKKSIFFRKLFAGKFVKRLNEEEVVA